MKALALRAALTVGAVSMLATSAVATAAWAQGAAAPAEAPIVQGPPIANFCVWAPQGIMDNSKVGQSVLARLKLLASNVQAELQPEVEAMQAEQKAIQAGGDPAQMQVRKDSLQLRYQNYVKKGQLREQELQATHDEQFGIIAKQLQPIVKELYQQHRCSILINEDTGAISQVNPAMDLSHEAVGQLDLKVQSLTFDRKHLDQGQPGAAPQR